MAGIKDRIMTMASLGAVVSGCLTITAVGVWVATTVDAVVGLIYITVGTAVAVFIAPALLSIPTKPRSAVSVNLSGQKEAPTGAWPVGADGSRDGGTQIMDSLSGDSDGLPADSAAGAGT